MTDTERMRELLDADDLATLFRQELGWDNPTGIAPVMVTVDSVVYEATAVASKENFVVFRCNGLPDAPGRHRVEAVVSQRSAAHLLIFVDRSRQQWQWVVTREGRTPKLNVHTYQPGGGHDLIERLSLIAFDLDDEGTLNVLGVRSRVDDALRAEAVTQRFYEQFQEQHDALAGLIEHIDDGVDREWYASLLLNRLMFLYFMQRKGFLDNDTNYLANRLSQVQALRGPDQFYTFYRAFLLPLFEQGLNSDEVIAEPDLAALIGDVPYLNGGIFSTHELEARYEIEVPDSAFEAIFSFFDSWRWHLDDSSTGDGNTINPDILGHIFERYVNQKQMGAYYTKEDITRYISASTLVPLFLDRLGSAATIANAPFEPWGLLAGDVDRYLPAAATQLDALAKSETTFEAAARVDHFNHVRSLCESGAIRDPDELVTYNLDAVQFAVDAISESHDARVPLIAWQVLQDLTVLDPTCGSGAFLFAILDVLEELYDAAWRGIADGLAAELYADADLDFAQRLQAEMATHPSVQFFILKQAILKNIYGVDIMQEAVEIAKLRLFLKLASVLQSGTRPEPLPDLDFNLRAGNALVGALTSRDAGAASVRLDFDGQDEAIESLAATAEKRFDRFRAVQAGAKPKPIAAARSDLAEILATLQAALDARIAHTYGVDPDKDADLFASWRENYKPLHWYTQFHAAFRNGGFDCIVGNPPYVTDNADMTYKVRGYTTAACKDLYAYVMERSMNLLAPDGRLGMIVPISIGSTDGYLTLRQLFDKQAGGTWCLHFAERPAKLFTGAEKRLTIWIAQRDDTASGLVWSTTYRRWHADERPNLFPTTQFVDITEAPRILLRGVLPKLGTPVEADVLAKVASFSPIGASLKSGGKGIVYYTRKLRYYAQFFSQPPKTYWADGTVTEPTELKELRFVDSDTAWAALAALNSTVFFWFLTVHSDVRNLNKREVLAFPLALSTIKGTTKQQLIALGKQVDADFTSNSYLSPYGNGSREIQTFQPRLSRPIINEIDAELANHFGLTDSEAEFIANFQGRFRSEHTDESED